jgi:hypothetical protein
MAVLVALARVLRYTHSIWWTATVNCSTCCAINVLHNAHGWLALAQVGVSGDADGLWQVVGDSWLGAAQRRRVAVDHPPYRHSDQGHLQNAVGARGAA